MVDSPQVSRAIWSRPTPGVCTKRKLRRWLTVLLISIAVPACNQSDADVANGDDPMQALAVPHLSERYDVTYWTQTSARDKDLWAQAVSFCEGKDPREYPNCNVIRSVEILMPRPVEGQADSTSLRIEPMAPDTFDPR